MEIAKIRVDGTVAYVVSRKEIPSGLAGATITVEYVPGIWDNLTKTVVFKGAAEKDVITNDTVVEIPPEVLESHSRHLDVGFFGVNADDMLIIPTLWCNLGRILPGTDPSGDTSTEPGLPVWAQLADQIANLNERVDNMTPGGGGGGGDVDLDGYATEEWVSQGFQPKGDYAKTSDIPTKTSQLQNDSGFLTQDDVTDDAVRYSAQELTPEQQAQARENIGVKDLLLGSTEEIKPVQVAEALAAGRDVTLYHDISETSVIICNGFSFISAMEIVGYSGITVADELPYAACLIGHLGSGRWQVLSIPLATPDSVSNAINDAKSGIVQDVIAVLPVYNGEVEQV